MRYVTGLLRRMRDEPSGLEAEREDGGESGAVQELLGA
jgi:hypothetical protein